METIGKILSLTLLTIFGSAAATVYMVDSSFFPSLLEEAPVTYTSDDNLYLDESQLEEITDYRKSQANKYVEIKSEPRTPINDEGSVWGNNYYSTSSSASGNDISKGLANDNSMPSLKRAMNYWDKQYEVAVKSGKSTRADKSKVKYNAYKKAVDIKKNSQRY